MATDTEVNSCFSIYKSSEIIQHEMTIFNSFVPLNDNNFCAQMLGGE